MTLLVKDANTTTQSIGTQPDATANLAIEHALCVMVGGVATPVGTGPGTASVPVEPVAAAAALDGSGTITAGGTAQLLFSGAVPVNGFSVQNNHASETMWVNDNGTAGTNAGFQVVSGGGIYTTPVGYKPMGAVSIEAASTSHPFTARRW